MPEGAHASTGWPPDSHRRGSRGRPVRASSPQGKFADGAALLDGRVLTAAEAHGKHLFLGFDGAGWVHVHLGLFGKVGFGDGARAAAHRHRPAAAGRRAAALRRPARPHRLRADHRRREAGRARPARPRPAAPRRRPGARLRPDLPQSRTTVAALLMDQKVIAGVGNVYRAEVLFRHGIDPYLRRPRPHAARSGTRSGPTSWR